MREFVTAVEEVIVDDEREEKILALMESVGDKKGLTREQAEAEVEEAHTAFTLDGREIHAYQPKDGQLAFMLAALGRGQTADGRFAAIINIMLSCLREEDKDYIEKRLLSRGKDALPIKVLEQIFEDLTEEWFARPTKQP